MTIQAILLPLFVEVALTLGLLVWLFLLRRRDLVSRTVHPSKIALREPNWPQRTQQIANSFSNQFELPALFYVLTVLEIITRHADVVFVVLAWIFVIGRGWARPMCTRPATGSCGAEAGTASAHSP